MNSNIINFFQVRVQKFFFFEFEFEFEFGQNCRVLRVRVRSPVLNNALRIVTGCLRPTPMDHLSILGMLPAEFRRLGATLSLAYRGSPDPDHILHGLLSGSSDAC